MDLLKLIFDCAYVLVRLEFGFGLETVWSSYLVLSPQTQLEIKQKNILWSK